ncbi:MAG: ice-binding family protein [Candidatus Nanopelagicaceae bacterium]|nr:ice-binding family protein [Candidatus Nanopelagicaceae bacterium]
MNTQKKSSILRILAVLPFLFLSLYAPTSASALTPTDYLGNAVSFGVLANTPSITNTGATTITGTAGNNVGIAPAASFTGAGSVTMTGGTVHLNDTAAQNAQTSLTAAYTTLSTLSGATVLSSAQLGGRTLAPGVYSQTSLDLDNRTLTLDGGGDPNALFVFQSGSTLVTAASVLSKVVLINQAQACNVYWTVASATTIEVGSTFVGHILGVATVTAKTGAQIEGQLLSRDAAVTMDTNVITNNACAAAVVIKNYSVTYHGNTNTTGTAPIDSSSPYYTPNSVVTVKGFESLVKTDFTFSHWNTKADNSGTSYAPASIFVINSNVDLYAQWTPVPVMTPTPTPTPVATPTPTPTPVVTPTPTPTPTPIATPTPKPTKTVMGGKLPKTGSSWYNYLAIGTGLVLIGGFGLVSKKRRS